jgi:protein arginine N-methyltransferase 1
MVYDVGAYAGMIKDRARVDAHARALSGAIRPGDVVVDLGAGTGILTLHACRLGAARVHAIEPSPAIELARRAAEKNGFADRIVFHEAPASAVTLERKADVLVADLRGVLSVLNDGPGVVAEASRRLLRQGGVLIPQRDEFLVALVRSPEVHAKHARPLDGVTEFDLEAHHEATVNSLHRARITAGDLASAPRPWAELAFGKPTPSVVGGEASLVATCDGPLHGLALWFRADLAADVTLESGPGNPDSVYGSAFLPFHAPLPAQAGETVRVRLEVRGRHTPPLVSWETRWTGANGWTIEYLQSSFHGQAISHGMLRQAIEDRPLALTDEGRIALFVLRGLEAGQSPRALANCLQVTWPDAFADEREAIALVAEVATRHAR